MAQQREPARSVPIFFKFIWHKKIKNKICRLENAGLSYRYKIMEQLGRIALAQLWNDPEMISVVICSHFWSVNEKPRYNY
ncbi:hypothetical protein CUN60_06905 [Aquella oligotrophica]|uniref:Uncharacterized protein n=1 Tax=Aquella oligotrophica TaxID=2067065 RepID=A0A2I7N6D5_9NEIS|nr:hypothetical protein CUN60_06905 [Aquella oligotrophica]